MNLVRQKHNDELYHQFLFYRLALHGIDKIAWLFYFFLLFQATETISSIMLDMAIANIFLLIGFIGMSFLIGKLGYLRSFRLQAVLHFISAFSVLFLLSSLGQYFLVVSILRGFSSGTFWATNNVIQLKDLSGSRRSHAFSYIESTKMVFSVLIPIFSGLVIGLSHGYKIVFFISALCFLAVAFFPFSYNKKIKGKVSFSEIKQILNIKHAKRQFLYMSVKKSILQYAVIISLFIPFLLFQDEFFVGIFISGVSLIGAIVAYLERYLPRNKKFKQASISRFLLVGATLALSIFWNGLWLLIREAGGKLMVSFSYPVESDLEEHTNQKILGKYRSESAMEYNIISESVVTVGRVVVLISMFILLTTFEDHQEMIIRVSYPIAILALFLSLYWIRNNHEIIHEDEY